MLKIEDLLEKYNRLFWKLVNTDDKAQERYIPLHKEVGELYIKIRKEQIRLERVINKLYIGYKSNAKT